MAYGEILSDKITTSDGVSSAGLYGLKNRIFNGDMRIDQRNAGASVTVTTANQYTVDRWQAFATQSSKYTAQQNAGSVTPPTGFTNYLGITSSSAYSVISSDYFFIRQGIEGFNTADLAWGTASAQSITLSFWVRSSLTGTFGGSFTNAAGNRSYPFTYTITSANTWERETITIAGDTTGTWLTTNGGGIYVYFGLGIGSTGSGTAGTWAGSAFYSATGATSVVGTNGATFYITGVQLEKGSTATSFDYLDYGRSLAQCQRYYYRVSGLSVTYGDASAHSTTSAIVRTTFPVSMRVAPSALDQTGTASNYAVFFVATGTASSAVPSFRDAGTNLAQTTVTVASGLTGGQAGFLYGNAAGAYLGWSAEL